MSLRFLIIGSGFSGSVLTNRLLQNLDCTIDIWDERSHAGGNCHTQRDGKTGIMVHEYGPHIFNTDKEEIWDYVNGFGEFKNYVHRVKAVSNDKIYSFPLNLLTINQFFKKVFSPQQAKAYLKTLADTTITNPKNFEEQALHFIGKDLYNAFFYGYTKKQWGCEPSELPASILKRIPVRFNYDDNYHSHEFTGIPIKGYSALMQKMIDNKRVNITLNKKYIPGMDVSGYSHVFYTGPIDAFFNYEFGRLGYRTVVFEKHYAKGDYQGLAQMNYCDESIPFTRIVEHKFIAPWEKNDNTVYVKEFSKETTAQDIPYYPKRLQKDKIMLRQYRHKASETKGVSFLGRLATYRYMDMHHVIGEALQFAEDFSLSFKKNVPLPIFPNIEE